MTALTADTRQATRSTPPKKISRANFNIQPLRAFRAVKRLIADKEDTSQVFEIMRALSGRSTPRGYTRLLKTLEGGRQAYLHVEFADKLQDKNWVAQFGPGTVGKAYADFIAPRGLSAYGLVEESLKPADAGDINAEHPVAWFARRQRDIHDVWHVLTGYGTDALGEVCIVAFSYPQTRNFGFGFIAMAGANEFRRRGGSDQPYVKAIRQAYRNSKKAAWLPGQDYEALFAEPLEAARKRLNIAPPTIYQSIPAELRDGSPN